MQYGEMTEDGVVVWAEMSDETMQYGETREDEVML